MYVRVLLHRVFCVLSVCAMCHRNALEKRRISCYQLLKIFVTSWQQSIPLIQCADNFYPCRPTQNTVYRRSFMPQLTCDIAFLKLKLFFLRRRDIFVLRKFLTWKSLKILCFTSDYGVHYVYVMF